MRRYCDSPRRLPWTHSILTILLIFSFVTKPLPAFIIQAIKLQNKNQTIILYSDLHMPCQYSKTTIEKQKKQNLKLKKALLQANDLTVLFEGYPEDQKIKLSKQQIDFAHQLTTPAFIDILPQTLNNNKIKIIPADNRKTINTAFINLSKTVAILTPDSIDDFAGGTAKIKSQKKLTANEKMQLQILQDSCPTFNQIFSSIEDFVKDTKSKLEKINNEKLKKQIRIKLNSIESEINICKRQIKQNMNEKAIAKILKLTQEYYYKNKDLITSPTQAILNIYETAVSMFSINLLFKIIENKKEKAVAIFAGQEHIENLKSMLEILDYKEKQRIEDKNTIRFVENLENELESTDLISIQKELDKKAKNLKGCDKIFDWLAHVDFHSTPLFNDQIKSCLKTNSHQQLLNDTNRNISSSIHAKNIAY